ncbi:hypothetical protein JFV29_14080 [Peribacillus sp. TH16]|uniref:hypothetical protein n=1 Tax=Peribacillus sp. TH16 TaxID=2798482 RepID=UPI001911D183|nr:hypothetical protein [Peribacillus sp. TH16]MBK5482975.1 hypothetical protein [Peribacillus sp. TH16]MBK5482999.1 hypothetical protein [Peribacillus sp. TH16]
MIIIDMLRSDGSIVVNKNLVHAIGLNAAILYSELISKRAYFENREQLTEDGFFFNTVDNIRLDTGLGEKPQSAAIKQLEKLGLIKTDKRGLPARRYFKIVDDDSLVMNILSEGKQKKSELEQELELKNQKKKEIHTSYINSSAQMEELVQPNGRINNTNLNNIKNNNNINIYIISDENDVFSYYSFKYKGKFGKEHPTMNKDKIDELTSMYHEFTIDLDIDENMWHDLVDYHFENLSPKNNGNILSFLAPNGGSGCIYRYIESINTEDEEDDYREFESKEHPESKMRTSDSPKPNYIDTLF